MSRVPAAFNLGGRVRMIELTTAAKDKLREYMASAGESCRGLRIEARRHGRHTFQYNLTLAMEGDVRPEDVTEEHDGVLVVADAESAAALEGATVDFVSDLQGAGFKVDNPAAQPSWDDPVAQKVQQVLEEKVVPAVAGHGGFVELLDVKGDTAFIFMGGGCQGCGMASVTLKQGIETTILENVPEIRHVVDHTDHAAGDNPYY